MLFSIASFFAFRQPLQYAQVIVISGSIWHGKRQTRQEKAPRHPVRAWLQPPSGFFRQCFVLTISF